MITHDQLMFALKTDYPGLVHGVDYWVGQEMNGTTQTAEAKLYAWNVKDTPQPDQDMLVARATALLPHYEQSIIPPPQTVLSARDFRKRFTLDEQMAIRQASMVDMEVGLVYDDFNRATIDLADLDTAADIDLYISKGLLAPERKAELLTPTAA